LSIVGYVVVNVRRIYCGPVIWMVLLLVLLWGFLLS
jgi:hypothetical protein